MKKSAITRLLITKIKLIEFFKESRNFLGSFRAKKKHKETILTEDPYNIQKSRRNQKIITIYIEGDAKIVNDAFNLENYTLMDSIIQYILLDSIR